jgi:hypothetical protein
MKINMEYKTVVKFNYKFLRGIRLEYVGTAAYGECMKTISLVKEDDFTSWIIEWAALADRVSKYAEKELNSNKKVDHYAYLLASNLLPHGCILRDELK